MAGGQSKRMGGVGKLLLPWGNSTIYEHVLRSYSATEAYKVAVINDAMPQLASLSEEANFTVLSNDNPEEGQSYSVRLAMEYWEKEGILNQLDGILFSVGDQPLLTKRAVRSIVEAFEGHPKQIVCPNYGGRPGNPVLFGSHWFSALRSIRGDMGGRPILKGEGQSYIDYVELDSKIGVDIDTPERYEELYRLYGKQYMVRNNL